MTNNIASERVKAKLTQDDLAEKLGVTRASIMRWEAGDTPLKVSLLVAMADLFGCSLDYLMGRTEERTVRMA